MAPKTPNIVLQQLRGSSIPAGYLLGRVSAGVGAVELVSLAQAQANGLVPTAPTSLPPNGPAGGDLSGTYPNPGVAALRGILLNSTAPTSGQVLTYDGTELTWETPTGGGIILGSGAPTTLEAAGTLYSQTDTDAVWSSQPIAENAAVVQTAIAGGAPTKVEAPTLGSAPTAGNLILAFLTTSDNESDLVDGTKWTTAKFSVSGDVYAYLVYRYAQSGDTAALPSICTSGSTYWGCIAYEIENVSGTFATDVPYITTSYANTGNFTTPSQDTSAANQLAVIGAFDWNVSGNITNPSDWTEDQAGNGMSGATIAYLGTHQSFPASGTDVSATIECPTAPANAWAITAVVNGLGSVENWDLIGPTPAATGANPTATAGAEAIDGSAATFMRSDGAPAVATATDSALGLVKPDGTTITIASGVISAAALPALAVILSANQDMTNAAYITAELDTVIVDTLGAWNAAEFYYQPPAGTYVVWATSQIFNSGANVGLTEFRIYKNGLSGSSLAVSAVNVWTVDTIYSVTAVVGPAIVTVNGTDTLSFAGYTEYTSDTSQFNANSGDGTTAMYAVKIG